jgi:hypothetical protein
LQAGKIRACKNALMRPHRSARWGRSLQELALRPRGLLWRI